MKLGPSATEAFAVREERVYDETVAVSSMTPDVLATWVQNKALSDAGRRQLEQIAQKKREIADNDAALKRADSDVNDLTRTRRGSAAIFKALTTSAANRIRCSSTPGSSRESRLSWPLCAIARASCAGKKRARSRISIP